MQTTTRNALAIVAILLAAWFFALGVRVKVGGESGSGWWSLALIASAHAQTRRPGQFEVA